MDLQSQTKNRYFEKFNFLHKIINCICTLIQRYRPLKETTHILDRQYDVSIRFFSNN